MPTDHDRRAPGCIDRPVECNRCRRTVMLSTNPALDEVGIHRPMPGGADFYICKTCEEEVPTMDYERHLEAARKDARNLDKIPHVKGDKYGHTPYEDAEAKADYAFAIWVVGLVVAVVILAFFFAWLAGGAR